MAAIAVFAASSNVLASRRRRINEPSGSTDMDREAYAIGAVDARSAPTSARNRCKADQHERREPAGCARRTGATSLVVAVWSVGVWSCTGLAARYVRTEINSDRLASAGECGRGRQERRDAEMTLQRAQVCDRGLLTLRRGCEMGDVGG